jgi:V8-like Glu-specific endopeptidase
MLTIRHVNGTLVGTETKLEPGKNRIVFGRQLDCDIQFPPEEAAVARHHFALVRAPSGSWTVELFGAPFVAINGVAADIGAVVLDGAQFELGRIGGPSFTVGITDDARADNYVRTAVQQAAPSPRILATRAGTLARIAAAVAVVLGLGGAGYATYVHVSARNNAARLDAAQKDFSAALAREASLRIGADVRARLTRAVYQVQLQDAQGSPGGGGTAWVIGPNLLATNAHVAVMRETLTPGERMTVRAPGENGAVLEVVEHKIHPGYFPFRAFLRSDRFRLAQYRGHLADLEGNGYDVAYLRVNGTLPEDARLTLATTDELNALASGTPLAIAGYPSEGLSFDASRSRSATPQLHVGVVASTTDMFGFPAPLARRQMINHDLPTAGGMSGAPLVGVSGRVVALHNAGNYFFIDNQRISHAALVNRAQRVDLLKELLDGSAETKLPDALRYWQLIAKDFTPQGVIERARPAEGVSPKLIARETRAVIAKDGESFESGGRIVHENTLSLSKKLTPGFDYLFLAIVEGGTTPFNAFVDRKMTDRTSAYHYPFIRCRLLTPAQQNTGNPAKPRAACVRDGERTEAMKIPPGEASERDVQLVLYNAALKEVQDRLTGKMKDNPRAATPLEYTLRIYQWVPDSVDIVRPRNPFN